MSMHQMYSKFLGTDKIRVFTSMYQMYSKFSDTDKIWVSAFTLLGLVISRYPSDGYYDVSIQKYVFCNHSISQSVPY